ncbi:MAG: glycosyltransferase [Actinobacteria bacterium]|nr:glycosyltransferase [Actinomycetota bacterium]
MHVAIFTDLHPMSLGGLQTSVRLQRKYLERMGVEVTIFSSKSTKAEPGDKTVILPSRKISPDGEYAATFNVKKAYQVARREFQRKHFDIIHLQGDFATAAIALNLSKEFSIPLIHHAHTNIDVVLERILGKRLNARIFDFASRLYTTNTGMERAHVENGWEYMALTYPNADLVVVPSNHFAQTIKGKGIATKVEVMPNGVDDDAVANIRRQVSVPGKPIRFIWAGRFLREKRLLQTIRAFKKAGLDAELHIYGTGPLEKPARSLVRTLRISDKVSFFGRVERDQMMQAFADSDVVLQTSIGFETQGMTVFEAAAFGTPALCCDNRVASELKPGHYWVSADESIESLAQAMTQAHKDISSGNAKRDSSDPGWLLQSRLTAKMVGIYTGLIQARR